MQRKGNSGGVCMGNNNPDLTVERLGECKIPSPITGERYVGDDEHVLYHTSLPDIEKLIKARKTVPLFELAGPREKIYFDPSKLKCGIVTCGGICPGLDDVIRAIVLALYHHYKVRSVFGFRYGYEGLTHTHGHEPIELDPEVVGDIHKKGGTILGSSRGPQDVTEMVDTLERMNIGLLFTIGGDGTLRGAQAISEEIKKRKLKIGVIGVPKTIDNDISFVDRSFGFETAIQEAQKATYAGHTEAEGARNGVGLVKLMGRDSGFIAAYAALVSGDVNFCLIPEVPFKMKPFLEALKERLQSRNHAVVVVAEGAGQDLLEKVTDRDESGNIRYGDIGVYLRDEIKAYFKKIKMDLTLKYIDPSYIIRSVPANAHDSAFCLLLGQNAAHAGMAGRTNTVIGYWKRNFTHVPIRLAVSERKCVDAEGRLWNHVLAATGQPRDMT
jgi:6-phosphofructokinase 1